MKIPLFPITLAITILTITNQAIAFGLKDAPGVYVAATKRTCPSLPVNGEVTVEWEDNNTLVGHISTNERGEPIHKVDSPSPIFRFHQINGESKIFSYWEKYTGYCVTGISKAKHARPFWLTSKELHQTTSLDWSKGKCNGRATRQHRHEERLLFGVSDGTLWGSYVEKGEYIAYSLEVYDRFSTNSSFMQTKGCFLRKIR